jgi:cytochrome c2
VGALALTIGARQSAAQAQARKGVDPAQAAQGKQVFVKRGCNFCHTIGKTGATAEGPDLGGVTERRTHEWLVAWLKDPNAMFGADAAADAMYEQYHHVKMPNMHLGEAEISSLLAYLATNPAAR